MAAAPASLGRTAELTTPNNEVEGSFYNRYKKKRFSSPRFWISGPTT